MPDRSLPTSPLRRFLNLLHPDRPAWTWMPTLPAWAMPLWRHYSWWKEERDARR